MLNEAGLKGSHCLRNICRRHQLFHILGNSSLEEYTFMVKEGFLNQYSTHYLKTFLKQVLEKNLVVTTKTITLDNRKSRRIPITVPKMILD